MTRPEAPAPFLTAKGAGEFAVSGPVTFATAGPLLDQGRAAFTGQQTVTVNLGGVIRVDSAGLALLLEWLRLARIEGRAMRFTALPDKLLAIARLSGVDGLLADVYSGSGPAPGSSSISDSASSSSASSR